MSAELIARVRGGLPIGRCHATQWSTLLVPLNPNVTMDLSALVASDDVLALCTTVETLTAERDVAVAGRQAAEDDARAMVGSRNAALAKLATAESERDAAREAFDNLSNMQRADRSALVEVRAELATLRETLVDKVRAIDDEDIPTHEDPSQTFLNGIDHGVTFALDRAITAIREAK